MAGFIKYMRSEEAEFLLGYPNANHLFMVMAFRARRTDHPMNGLKAGQCFLGDYASIGLTERQYRTAKKQLTDWNLATFKGTNKGTVGTLLNSKVYDINEEARDGQCVTQETGKRQASDRQATTNKECKNQESKEKKPSKAKPTSVQEVQDYFAEKGYGENGVGQKFIDHYDSIGWKRGKQQVKDWKATARTWMQRMKPVSQPVQQQYNQEEARQREIEAIRREFM